MALTLNVAEGQLVAEKGRGKYTISVAGSAATLTPDEAALLVEFLTPKATPADKPEAEEVTP